MAHALGATVIVLQSHPAWVAAQARARELDEAMRRHPSFSTRGSIVQGDVGQRRPWLPEHEVALKDVSREQALRDLW
jgi:hypothetical protein